MRPHGILLVFAVALTGCSSTLPPMLQEPREVPVEGTYTHRPSKIAFPPAINKFSRIQVMQFDAIGETTSVIYKSAAPACSVTATLTIYVAPGHVPIEPLPSAAEEAKTILVHEHFNALKKAILQSEPHAKLLAEEETTLFQAGGAKRGRRGLFEYEDTMTQQSVRADLYLFILGKWALKYRFVYSAAAETCASAAVNDFLLAFSWPRTS